MYGMGMIDRAVTTASPLHFPWRAKSAGVIAHLFGAIHGLILPAPGTRTVVHSPNAQTITDSRIRMSMFKILDYCSSCLGCVPDRKSLAGRIEQ